MNQEYLKSILSYDSTTGEFRWIVARKKIQKGAIAGSFWRYHTILIDGQRYPAHRLAWLYVYGEWPIGDLDHENRNKLDNRITNLVPKTRKLNMLNTDLFKHNTSGVKGVIQLQSGKWRARLGQENLGHYDSKAEASTARAKAEKLAQGLESNDDRGSANDKEAGGLGSVFRGF